MSVDELRASVLRLQEKLIEVERDVSSLASLAQMIARLEQIVENIRADLSEMKEEWMRIRGRVHKLEGDNAAAVAAAAALEAAQAQRIQAQQIKDESDAASWTRKTRRLVLAVALCGAFGGLVGAAIAIYELIVKH